MKTKTLGLVLGLVCGLLRSTQAREPERLDLNGSWAFAADYLDLGQRNQWFSPSYKDAVWDRVTTPHVWSMDPRFPYYIGAGWYRRQFLVPPEFSTQRVRLVFEAVNERARVWLNGKLIAEHEGGYTPFETDVTAQLDCGKTNLLVVCADNRWQPWVGGIDPQNQVKAWMEDGGIIRDAYLVATPPVYIRNQKVAAVPDLARGTASVRVTTWIDNASNEPAEARLTAAFWREQEPLSLHLPEVKIKVPANTQTNVTWQISLAAEQVRLWGLDTPVLYRLETALEGSATTASATFGIRKFEVQGTELWLNGRAVRLAGANRIANGTEFGQNDPVEFVERDLRLMKQAGLEFMRMHHVPLSRAVLDWADRHGLLLIEECSQATPANLDAGPEHVSYQKQQREMIERDWNRPSIVAWSVGNELASDTPAGLRWVGDMTAYTRSVDSTRLVCFASNRAARPNLKPEEEASGLTDFVCLNTYGATPAANAANMDCAHQRWPNKPFIVTEYGLRADRVASEADREQWFSGMFQIFRARPFISGASIWSFNDYRSRYVGTNPDGYRWWGIVDAKRAPRGSYDLFRREMSPVKLKSTQMTAKGLASNVTVKFSGRSDFPVYPPTDYQVSLEFFGGRGESLGRQSQAIQALAPGADVELVFPQVGRSAYFKGEIRRGDFLVMAFGPNPWSEPPE